MRETLMDVGGVCVPPLAGRRAPSRFVLVVDGDWFQRFFGWTFLAPWHEPGPGLPGDFSSTPKITQIMIFIVLGLPKRNKIYHRGVFSTQERGGNPWFGGG